MDIRKLLDDLEIKIVKERDLSYDFRCPFHKDEKPSFSMEKNSGAWICRAGCGTGTLYDFLMRFFNNDKRKVSEYFNKYKDKKLDLLKGMLNKKMQSYLPFDYQISEVTLPKEYIKFTESNLYTTPAGKYLLSRRISPQVIYDLNLGFCETGEFFNRIIIPIYFNRILVGYTSRTYIKDLEPRFKICKNFHSADFIFCYDYLKPDTALLSESIFDTLTIRSWGISNVVSTFSANITNTQIKLLLSKKIKNLYILFHNDRAGNAAVQKKLRLLKLYFSNIQIGILPEDRDVNDLDFKEFCEVKYVSI